MEVPDGQAYPAKHGPVHKGLVSPCVEPYRPRSHGPLHAAVVVPAEDPNKPTAHATHAPAPPTLYQPGGHSTAVALVEPDGQAKPGEQPPLHPEVLSPGTAPNSPAAQGPLQADELRALDVP